MYLSCWYLAAFSFRVCVALSSCFLMRSSRTRIIHTSHVLKSGVVVCFISNIPGLWSTSTILPDCICRATSSLELALKSHPFNGQVKFTFTYFRHSIALVNPLENTGQRRIKRLIFRNIHKICMGRAKGKEQRCSR